MNILRSIVVCKKLLIIFLLSFLNCNNNPEIYEAEKRYKIKDTLLLQIGDYKFTEDQFRQRVKKMIEIRNYEEGDHIKATREAWEWSLKIGFILAECYRISLDKDSLIEMHYQEAKRKVLEKYMNKIPENILNSVTERMIKKAYKRRNRAYLIGYIRINEKEKDDFNLILEKLRSGMNINNFFSDRSIEKLGLIKRGIKIEYKEISGGEILPVIENKIWKMDIGDRKIIKTNEAYHIVYVERIRAKKRKPFDRIRNLIRESIARSIIMENDIHNLYKINDDEIWIDDIKLAYCDLSKQNPKMRDHKIENGGIIVTLRNGENVTVEELKQSILKLTENNKRIFRIRNNRVLAVKNLVIHLPRFRSYFEMKLKESYMIEELIKQEVLSKIKINGKEIIDLSQRTGFNAQVAVWQLLEDKQKKMLQQSLKIWQQNNNVHDIKEKLIRQAYSMDFDQNSVVIKKMMDYKKQKVETCLTCEIREDILDEFSFVNENLILQMDWEISDNVPIATYKSLLLTFKEFNYALKGLSRTTLEKIAASEELKKKMLFSILKERWPDINQDSIMINEHLLKQFDPLVDTRINDIPEYISVSDDDVIARYGNHSMKLAELKEVINTWHEKKVEKFNQFRFATLKNYLESILWAERAIALQLDLKEYIKLEFLQAKEWLMLEHFFNKFVMNHSIFIEKEYYKEWLNHFIASDEEVKLNNIIGEIKKRFTVRINRKLMEKIGLPIEPEFDLLKSEI
jgi:hypothetical protein